MNKLIILIIIIISSSSCKKKKYEYNLKIHQDLISEINQYFMNETNANIDLDQYYAEDFIFYSYPVLYKKGIPTSKNDYINGLKKMKGMNMSINIHHTIYLPGLDEKSYKINGSVRLYYGATISIDTNYVDFSGYQTINFVDGKVKAIWEWADYGGVENQLNNFLQTDNKDLN